MNYLNQIFLFYDRIIESLPKEYSIILSVVIILALIWAVISVIRQGQWVFLAVIILLFPGGLAAIKNIGLLLWAVLKFLFTRIQINL